MLEVNLDKPPISQFCSAQCLKRIRDSSIQFKKCNVFITGRVSSGKTKFINLVADRNVFSSTGEQDCTRDINLFSFRLGLNIFDLPGAASDDVLENFNRSSLGIEQLPESEQVDYLSFIEASQDCHTVSKPKRIDSNSFKQQFKPDIILYMVAHNQGFYESDQVYLSDLLKKYKSQVIFALNIFPDVSNSKSSDDCKQLILNCCQQACGDSFSPYIQEINCLTGKGLSSLFLKMKFISNQESQKIFSHILDISREDAQKVFVSFVKHELVKLLAYAPSQKPTRLNPSKEGYLFSNELKYLAITALDYIGLFSTVLKTDRSLQNFLEILDEKINLLAHTFTNEHFEDLYDSRRIPIYEKVPVYKDVYVTETDYDSPIYEEKVVYEDPDDALEGIGNLWNTSKWERKRVIKTIAGYGTKSVKKTIIKKYKKEECGCDYEYVKTGVKKVGESFKNFGSSGIALVLASIYVRLIAIERENVDEFKLLSDIFDQAFDVVLETFKKIGFGDDLSVNEIKKFIDDNIDYFFDDDINRELSFLSSSEF